MRLLVIRHGKAEERDPDRWPDDGQRPLLPQGHQESRQLGRLLRHHDLQPDRLWSSPLVRAWQTAEAIIEGTEAPQSPEVCDLLGMDYTPDGLLDAIRMTDVASIALVGHEPDLSWFIHWLLGLRSGTQGVRMKKGTLALLDLSTPILPGHASLLGLIPPRWQRTHSSTH
ncbi:MAG: 2,3-bisphosphoglycerate-dependent phosphoglycerate mutase [bacterium]|nr:2,3-bisphosphoglycerate-dependent phosphoglycerate mutase [bacterium]